MGDRVVGGGSHRREVVRLTEEAERRYGRGDLAGAVERAQRACALVREAMEAGPTDLSDTQQLGSMLYALGEWLLQSGEHAAAVKALVEAEEAYQRLGGLAGQLVADVVIRRARVHAAAGQPLSAIAEAQQAVVGSLALSAEDDDDAEGAIPAARVLAWAAKVQLDIGGDPDVAVGAADWALREFLAAFRRDDRLELPAVHASAVRAAAGVAYVVHTAAGRDELARVARWFFTLASEGDSLPGSQAVARVVSSQPTLAQALRVAGWPGLIERLTAPATEVRILVPAMRCPAELAPAHAQTLSELLLDAPERDELLFGLEAHALFAAASQEQVPSMRHEFGHFGRQWAAAVVNFGQRHLEQDGVPAALDAAAWLTGIIGKLAPYALIDPQVRFEAVSLARWQHELYTAVGDAEAAGNVAQVIAVLSTEADAEPDTGADAEPDA